VKIQPLKCIETELETIALEAPQVDFVSPKKSLFSPAWAKRAADEFIPSALKLKQAEVDYDSILKRRDMLETRLIDESEPNAQAASDIAEQSRSRVECLREALDMLSQGMHRRTVTLGLTTSQICEVRQLARNPPENVRKVLMAIWLVLNCERFLGKSLISSAASRDWSRCQRMLADKSFVSRLQAFDPSGLDQVPHVLTHIARTYFGLLSSEVSSDRLGGCLSEGTLHGASSRPTLARGSLSKGSSQRSHGSLSSWNNFRTTNFSTSMSSNSSFNLPLDQEEVQHASKPCGVLLQWLRALVLDRARHAYLKQELSVAEAEAADAEKACKEAEMHVTTLRADLAAMRKQQEAREQTIKSLRQEMFHKQRQTDFLFSRRCPPQGHTISGVLDSVGDATVAWGQGATCAKPRKWLKRPTCVTKILTLQNSTWCEVTKMPTSPFRRAIKT
jgi:hypothetical protein